MSIVLYKKIFQDISEYVFGTNCFGYCGDIGQGLYPIDLEFTLLEMDVYYRWIDENGIPYRYYKSVGKQYNPTRIAAFGLANYNRWVLSGMQEAKAKFLKMAGWFLDNELARYEYGFDWEELKAPWISCMAQGEAASVLVRGYQLTSDERYVMRARQALETFLMPISKNGVQSKINNEFVFLEEYPADEPGHVLNGFLYALIGLIEYCDIAADDVEMIELRDQLVCSLRCNIDKWGDKLWSYYQMPVEGGGINYCTPKYHNLQITQLIYVSDRLGQENLKTVIERWCKGSNSFRTRLQALIGKIKFRLKNKAQR